MEQRVIKFRAWNEKEKQMADPFEARRGGTILWRSQLETAVTYRSLNQNDILLQFTGKKTKIGGWEDAEPEGAEEIYEGDIVLCWTSRFPDSKTKGWIEYNEHAQAFQVRYETLGGRHANDFMHKWHFFEVIGNIFTHPHLIKQ